MLSPYIFIFDSFLCALPYLRRLFSSISASTEAHHVEAQVKDMLSAVRAAHVDGLTTRFCPALGRVLQPLLWAYEMEPLLGSGGRADLGQELTKQVRFCTRI